MLLSEWLTKGLNKPGKIGRELSEILNVDPATVTGMKKGTREIKGRELIAIARYIEEPIPGLEELTQEPIELFSIAVSVIAEVGVWRDKDRPVTQDRTEIPVVPSRNVPREVQYCVQVADDHFNKEISPGGYAICVPYDLYRAGPQLNDLVHCQITRDGMVENVLRAVRQKAGELYLAYETDDPDLVAKMCTQLENIVGLIIASHERKADI